jgi:hypothetical protein
MDAAAAGLQSVHPVIITPQSPGAVGQTERLGCGAIPDDNAGFSSPSGSASPGAEMGGRRVVERLGEASCTELLSTGRIARLIYNSRYGPVALPSEYKIHEGSIVFRTYRVTFTEDDLRTGIAHAEYQVVVEVATSILTRARGGLCSSGARRITWILRPSVRRSATSALSPG